ncbi:unnamed protein product [Periconia digitata]|uniref:Uncharacterized protein n=1 Tax=Periconia digitata TaxID=1303443 RepID=A0A9W4UR64_9PLEO|nr:unnamed protein product [Periconia digitata]
MCWQMKGKVVTYILLLSRNYDRSRRQALARWTSCVGSYLDGNDCRYLGIYRTSENPWDR